jgi:hypothetical protein
MPINREDPFALMARYPQKFRPANPVVHRTLRLVIIVIEAVLQVRHTLIGGQHLRQAQAARDRGQPVVLDMDHWGWSDIVLPLGLFWWRGYRPLTRKLFFLIGMRWIEKFWVKFGDRAYLVPPVLWPENPTDAQALQLAKYVAEGFRINDEQITAGKMTWAASQGTRARPERGGGPPGIIPPERGAWRIWRKAALVVPVALEGTERITPVKTWFPRFWHPLKVFVGEPIPVSGRSPTAEEVAIARAMLHIEHGDPRYAGAYREEAERRLAEKRAGRAAGPN